LLACHGNLGSRHRALEPFGTSPEHVGKRALKG
jgi:hypothetical protein